MSGILRKITEALTKELRAFLREYAHETEKAAKKRLKRLVIYGLVTSILVSLVISLLGSAALFLLIGSLEYLRTFMPAWKAWDIVGLTSGAVAGLLFLALFTIIRKELKT
jgi:tetrahydromethanopterin S-methyltransferase subunit G